METTVPPASAPASEEPTSRTLLASVAVAAIALALGGALGAAGGWLWYRWWGPPDVGGVYDAGTGPTWGYGSERGIEQVFAATAEFAVVGLALGLVLGVVTGLVGRHRALVALGAVLVGSVLAAVVASRVGFAMSPPDPHSLVDDVEVGTRVPAAITLSGWTPYLLWPIGALVGFVGVVAGGAGLDEVRRHSADHSTWLERQTPA